jgi:hypothetical protein
MIQVIDHTGNRRYVGCSAKLAGQMVTALAGKGIGATTIVNR